MQYTKLLKQIQNYETARKAKLTVPINPYKMLPTSFCETLVADLADIKLIRNEAGKVSATETLKGIIDPELNAAAKIPHYAPRSSLLTVAAKLNPKYASLTPLLMLGHKEKAGVPYEEWDKEDPLLMYALGSFLQCLIDDELVVVTIDNIAEVRILYHGPGKPVTAYTGKMVQIPASDGLVFKLPGSRAYSKMLLQVWIAHVSLRVPNAMILDPYNWDNVPEPYDDISPVKETSAVEDNLPW